MHTQHDNHIASEGTSVLFVYEHLSRGMAVRAVLRAEMARCWDAGNLNGIHYDKLQPLAVPLRVREAGPAHAELFTSSLFGPTWCV